MRKAGPRQVSRRHQGEELSTGEIQRKRVLDAVVDVVCERGVAGASVGLVTARAGVSSRTFYERFGGLEECLVAVLDEALERAAPLVVEAFAKQAPWQEGMRAALAAMLEFFDDEPALARVCLVELGAAAPVVRGHRERILAAFAAPVVARIESEVSHPSPLAAEATYASVVGIVNARLTAPDQPPLIELLGPLMGIIVAPFMDEGQVKREMQRGDELARELLAQRALRTQAADAEAASGVSIAIPAALRDPRAHRARKCLCYVVAQAGRGFAPSNREIGAAIGVSHRGQLAALLAQLLDLGLLSKRAGAPGHPNAWRATSEGEIAASALEALIW